MPMTPGTYLRKRREATGLDLDQVAITLARLPWAVRATSPYDVLLLKHRLHVAETGLADLTPEQAQLLRPIFRFDAGVYEQLFLLQHAGIWTHLPEPQVCRGCACSWHDACTDGDVACSWTADPALCSACARQPASRAEVTDWPDAPHPEGTPA